MLVGLWLLRFERADGCIFVVDLSDERARSRARGMQDLRSGVINTEGKRMFYFLRHEVQVDPTREREDGVWNSSLY